MWKLRNKYMQEEDAALAIANAATSTDIPVTVSSGGGGRGIDGQVQTDEEKSLESDMAALFDDSDPVDELTVEDNTPPAPVVAPVEIPNEPPVQAVALAQTVPTPTQEVVQPLQATSQVQTPPAQEAPSQPEVNWEESRNAARAELEKRYALSPEDADAMISEPEKVLPKLASQMYLDIYESVMSSMQALLPQAVHQVTYVSARNQKDESDFYGTWPALKNEQFQNDVLRIGKMYRQMNPQASKEQFIQEVGVQAMLALKLPLPNMAPPAPTQPQVPYSPPRGSAVVPQAPRQSTGNQFTDLAMEWESDN
jgi:hypothetical protein